MAEKAFQDYYPDQTNYCYGCGRLNEYGLQIKSYWDGDEAVCDPAPVFQETFFGDDLRGIGLKSLFD